jgi:ferredoxin
MSASFIVRFPGTRFAAVALPGGARLAEHLDARNSPLLFGCRTGICGTCRVDVLGVARGSLTAPDPAEREVLELCAADAAGSRLACQIRLEADLDLAPAEG